MESCYHNSIKFRDFAFLHRRLICITGLVENETICKSVYCTLERFDAYLWCERDSNGDGCLETWCVYDTGEDNARRYADAPRWWESATAPQGYEVVPIQSMDFMSYSYAARDTLAKISAILQNDKVEYWKKMA